MPSEKIAALRWPWAMRIQTKGEMEHRRQQEYWKSGTKRTTKWLNK